MTTLTPSTSPRRPDHARRRVIVRWTKRIGLGLLGLGIAGGLVYAWMPKAVVVDLAVAHRAALEVEVAEDGQTRVRDRFVVSAPISGELRRIELEPGVQVAEGDVLGKISPPRPALLDPRTRREATARLAGAVARQRTSRTAIERAVMARDAAVRDADRARQLEQRAAIPAAERERFELTEQLAIRDLAGARLESAAASAEVEAARALVEDPRADGGTRDASVVAPAPGQVLRVLRDSEGPIAAGTPLLELGDPRAIEVVVDVLSSDAAQIRLGMVVSIERWGGDPLAGRVRRIEPSAFTRISALGVEEQRVNVIASLDAPPPALGDGFRVSARIITWRGEDVLSVPSSAVFRDHGRWAVYAVTGGRAVLQPVTLGHRGRLDVEVLDGLAAGAQLIVHPADNIASGTRVAPR
jgi:HlyD family secretion protein